MAAPKPDETERLFKPMTEFDDMDEDKALAGEYALGLMSSEDVSAFETRLVREPDLRDLVAEWNESLVGFTDEIAPQPVPKDVKPGIDATLFGSAPATSIWKSLGIWQAITCGAVAASVAMAVMLLQPSAPPVDGGTFLVAEVEAADNSLTLIALYDEGNGTLRLNRVTGMAAEGRDLELWIIAGDAAPKSLGVLPRDASGTLDISEALRPLLAGAVLAISDEPLGGSTTGSPTGAVLATGVISKI